MKQMKKIWGRIMAALTTIMVNSAYAFATSPTPTSAPTSAPAALPGASLETSKLVTGTQALLSDVTKVLLIVSGGLTITLVILNLLRLQTADDQEGVQIKKKIKMTVIIGVTVFLASGLISIIMSYYIDGGITI